jgi:ankyrin repeat protein
MSFADIKAAIMANSIKGVKDLIKANRAIVNVENDASETPLYMASYLGHLDIVELLIENGARINHKDTRGGWTALTLASSQGHNHIVEYLIIEGANLNEQNNAGDTALIVACASNDGNNYLYIIGLLLDEGVDISIKDNEGHDAMYYAERRGDPFVIQLLTNIEDARANRFALEIVPLNKSRIPATAEDVINAEDVNIEDFLAETPHNKIIKVGNSFYTLNTKDIRKHYLRQKHNDNYIYFPCRQTWPSRLVINKEDVYFDKPLFSVSYIVGVLSDFVLLDEVQAMIESGNQYFEIFLNEYEDIIATASGHMFSARTANAASANHCQPGKESKIFKMRMINIVEDAVEATIVKSLSKSLTEEVASEARAEGIRKRRRAKKKKSAKKKKKTAKKKTAKKKKKTATKKKKKKTANKKKKTASKKRRKL